MKPLIRPVNPWALPTAELVLPVDAPRQEWLAERRKGLGSSDAPLLMGVGHPDDSEYQLWLDKTGRAEPGQRTHAMTRGIWLEPHVVDHFAEKTGIAVRRCGIVRRKEDPILRASPDRLTADGGIVEIKTLSPWAKTGAEWRSGKPARSAWVQGQWQLMVTGRSHIWFCAYAIDSEPMIFGPYPPDEPLIDRMIRRGEFWWTTYVTADQAPPFDLETITDEEIDLRWPAKKPGTSIESQYPAYLRQMLIERTELKATEKAASDRAKEIDRALRAEAKGAEAIIVAGRPVVTFKTQTNAPKVDPTLETDLPEVWEKYVTRGTHRRIHVC